MSYSLLGKFLRFRRNFGGFLSRKRGKSGQKPEGKRTLYRGCAVTSVGGARSLTSPAQNQSFNQRWPRWAGEE